MSLEYFAAPGADDAKKLVRDAYDTLLAEYPSRDREEIWEFVKAEYNALARSSQAVTTSAIVSRSRNRLR